MIFRWIRRITGVALIGLSLVLLRETWSTSSGRRRSRDPRAVYGVDRATGQPTGLRINPLDPAEATAARRLEDDLWRAWLTAP